ncbi:hypothetical protein F503_07061 [Ophiostoma piceae UAMH 11346]|uniref:Uncharacterized protein n=1 Tax=Ophiostoma piceae (strain UAMH 11346) TaxID=1262450 RepID=S3D7B2_OPHP1|nr:hypothetical protein F503_07061 [Ophiostoma piceae UAMH 11346]
MSQWTKGKFKQRGPPPALFVQSSPAASSVSLAGAGDVGAGPPSGAAASGAGLGLGNTQTGASSLSTGMPSLPTLSRTASRFRTEASGGSGASGSAVMSPTSGSQKPTGEHLAGGAPADAGTGASLSGGTTATTLAAAGSSTGAAAAFTLPLPMPPLRQATSTRATDRTDALWAEMQATLEEVELSASEGTRVFGPDHDHKLAALREAQIALAQAWARSEAEEAGTAGASTAGADDGEVLSANNLLKAVTTSATSVSAGAGGGRDEDASASGVNKGGTGADDSAANHSRDRDNTGNPSSSAAGGGGRPQEQETQVDILLARKRREANDRYFQRVNQGVLDVVSKLEDVAGAMRVVEQESVDIWGGGSASGVGGDNESAP